MAKPELAFKCRRCRQYLFGEDKVLTTAEMGRKPVDTHHQNPVWYLKEEALLDWVQNAIDEAQWTKGKLNCPKCQGRLGSFDFITPNKTQMSNTVFSPIQVIRTRVDCESTSPIINRIHTKNKTDQNDDALSEDATGLFFEIKSSVKADNILCEQPVNIISSFAEATASITHDAGDINEHLKLGILEQDNVEMCRTQDFRNIAVRTISESGQESAAHPFQGNTGKRTRTVENKTLTQEFEGFDEQNYGEPEQHANNIVIRKRLTDHGNPTGDQRTIPSSENKEQLRQTVNQSIKTPSASTTSQTAESSNTRRAEVDDSLNILPGTHHVSYDNLENSSLNRQTDLESSEVDEGIQFIGTSFDGENSASWEDFFEEIFQEMQEMRTFSGRSDHNNFGLEEDQVTQQDLNPSETGEDISSPTRMRARERAALRRERNRRKKERRKQRRKERWMQLQGNATNFDEQEPDLAGLVDVLGTDWSRQALQEVTTCSICLDVFFQPHSCVPCNHIFCEPCLRQLASIHPMVAPCPLCRTNIQTVVEHYELTAAIKKLFPTQVQRRRQAERRTLHRSFPLPGHSSLGPISRPWFNIPRFRTSDTNERVQQFTSRVNRARQRRQELNRTFIQELSSETVATLFFFAIFVGVVIAFLSLMQEFA